MKKQFVFALAIVVCTLFVFYGCAGMGPANKNVKREFTYDYVIDGKSKSELWKNARNYFAEAYGDSRAVFRIMDEQDGTIIGKGTVSWKLFDACYTDYHVRFAAKDNKARLQFELIEGVPPLSPCTGWAWPTQNGYNEIVAKFNATSKELESALTGKGSSSKLKDF